MKTTFRIILLSIFTQSVFGQNLYPVKLDNCNTQAFCLDCGNIKAGYNESEFQKMLNGIAEQSTIKGISGSVYFQVLIDSKGKACVLSHTDRSSSSITKELIRGLNKFKYWNAATRDGKAESNTSINVIITIKEEKISAAIERFNETAFKESLRGSRAPEIYNEQYTYTNPSLNNYSFTAWHRENSDLPNDRNEKIEIDSNGVIWFTMDNSLGTMQHGEFKQFEQDIHEPGMSGFSHSALAIDNDNTTWISANKGIYSFNGTAWHYYNPSDIGIDGARKIITNAYNDDILFCTRNGLTINSNGNWSTIDKDSIPELPSNGISYANYDSKQRLWIGTSEGTVMIDATGQVTSFNEGETVLKGQSITSMTEDADGNFYFGLYEFEGKGVNKNEGIAVWRNDESWRHYTTENSGMPFNHTTDLAFDPIENVLWISTDRAGIVRYDLKENWENYHSKNSGITTSSVYAIEIDKNGTIYLGTTLGIVKIERK